MIEAEALKELAALDSRGIFFAHEADEIAGAFGFEPTVYPLSLGR